MRYHVGVACVVIASALTGCRAQPGRAVLSPAEPARYDELAKCAQTIALAEDFVATSSAWRFERPIGALTDSYFRELLQIGVVDEGDTLRAVTSVRRTDTRRSTSGNRSLQATRAERRIAAECRVAR